MFEAFRGHFQRDAASVPKDGAPEAQSSVRGLAELFAEFGGASFNQGLYRIVRTDHIADWRTRIGEAFPSFADCVCFGFDWLGRAFVLDGARLEDGQPGVLMLDPGAGEALEIPANLETFHDGELIEYGDAALASEFHSRWLNAGGRAPAFDQCVGYRKPLFLGGADELSNLELSDIDVYWSLMAQMMTQAGVQ
ncbi:MAG TPA: T6SS immunity protein Tdi1 domain-containing protein [Caulobacteraceae bacterium]|nr:T6SS immunity protein Tdi1 domain-containing protein [Caulobacteraceae bacterium]